MTHNNSLLITKFIRKIIVENIRDLDGRCYALDARTGTKLPFAVIIRDSVTPSTFTKDGLAMDRVSVSVYVASRDYDTNVMMSNDIRNLLDRTRYQTNDINISLIEFTGAEENYTDTPSPAFLTRLIFNAKIEPNY